MFNRKLKTCVTVSKLPRDQCSSTHDLPSLFAYSRNNRRRLSRCSRCRWTDEARLRAIRETISTLSGCGNCAAHDLPGVDHVVARNHPDGRIRRVSSSPPDCLTSWLHPHALFRG